MYTVIAVCYVLACAAIGLTRSRTESSTVPVAWLTAAMVCTQFALLLFR